MYKLALHWKIIIGLILGLFYGILSSNLGLGNFTSDYIAPFGLIFINLLKLIAAPLVLSSLITGVASLSDLKKLSKIGSKTISIYILTTAISVIIGLFVVNSLAPGTTVPQEMKDKLKNTYQEDVISKKGSASKVKTRGPLEPIVDIVPNNFFHSASNNRNMLQLVFVAIFIGIGLIQLSKDKSEPLLRFFSSLNDVIIKLVEIIMELAPIGVFSLIAQTINKVAGQNPDQLFELLGSLGFYMLTVIIGLIIHMGFTYTLIIKFFTELSLKRFFKGIAPAQLLAFSTSSSGATLPITMEQCEKELDVPDDISSFVLPLGATINMDGTALYQAVATVFIAQALGLNLDLAAQSTIVLTAVLASIGTAAVPGAGIIMLVIILESVGVPSEGIALILGVDRILDMIRTMTNVTGDATIAVYIANTSKSNSKEN